MDMQTVLLYICIIATIGYNSEAQQITKNLIKVASKPAPNNYVRLSEISFANAVRAIATPPRDYVPIHEPQQDNPPPPRPQPVTNQPVYNTYNQPQTYTNVVPISLGYNTQSTAQQIPNTPMSFQYITANDYPNEVYNFLYHTTAGNNAQKGNNAQVQANNGYLQGNPGYLQEDIGYQQGNNVNLQAATGYQQGNNVNLQAASGYQQANNVNLQAATRYQQGNHVNMQENNVYLQESTGYQQGNLQGHNYLQQAYNPYTIPGYQSPVTYMPVMNDNFGAVLPQGIKPVPVYNNYQSSNGYNNFRPSAIDLTSYENQIPTHRFRTGKSATLALPSNNVQYVSNSQGTDGFVPSTMYQYVSSGRSPRMTTADYGQGYPTSNSEYVSGRIEYVNLM